MEIERKWLLPALPQITSTADAKLAHVQIRQGYVCTETGELRVRDKGGKYYLTVKSDGTISREEWEREIPQWTFDLLWENCQNRVLEKIRYSLPYGQLSLEIDVYLGRLAGLIILEVEFASEKQARQFDVTTIAPEAIDVTAEKRYKDKVLATSGLPS